MRTAILQPAEVADLEAREDGSPPPEIRRAVRHGSGDLARRAEALAQSRLFDDLAKSAAHRRALLRETLLRGALSRAGMPSDRPSLDDLADNLTDDLVSYRSEGIVWQARSKT
jgi:hypothetical protein